MSNLSRIMKQLKRERDRCAEAAVRTRDAALRAFAKAYRERARAENDGSSPRRREQRSPLHRGTLGEGESQKEELRYPRGSSLYRLREFLWRPPSGSVLALCRASRREQLCLVYRSCRMVRLTGGSMLRRVLAEIGLGIGLWPRSWHGPRMLLPPICRNPP